MDDSRKVLQVTNITHSATDADLADLFGVAGDVARTSIIQSGFPYYAFVEYYNPNDARRALNLNGKFFGPSKITVEFATQPFPQQPLLGAAPGMGVNNDPGFRRPNLENPTRIISHENNPRPNQNNVNPNANIRPIVVQLNKPSNIAPENVTVVMLTNIPVSLKEHNLHQIFSEFGVVVDTVIIKDASGLTTGRGSVSFTSHESAVRAASTMDGKMLEGGHARLLCQVKDNNIINSGHANRGPGPVRDLRSNLSNNNNNLVRHHPYQNNPNPPRPQQTFNNNPPPPMFGQGPPPPQNQFHQHFDPVNNMNPHSTFDVHGGSTHSLTTAPNAPVIQQQAAAVYVGNLPETTCRNCLLYQLFAPYGAISSVKAMDVKSQREDVKSNWYGFVNYKDINCANVAILTLDKSTLDGQTLKVVMKTDKPGFNKGERRGQRRG